mmetsp:Transcript_24888/g.54163  ORF Transcript_24888/g.54163 Transcript_24888/m.54163 type:complete len:119 (-) Transcript_24888:487-843(-)|eukprot:CAMPEP_0202900106 /NCGR_PEP_ID=MMETSP1392-20130828/9843_1 /ASSEMBLY_ACC=CAM_ASM_000868 /TAXON_ID=225041 /ORGANISM="Chlamydomonas chlamydogama, Strain SAG 11-48b" /LENGTH=118 /DNA_ID=CAMNT_0049586423 /DNA_START=58 /DNA_END=414 /DNA_ORIENTATION=+
MAATMRAASAQKAGFFGSKAFKAQPVVVAKPRVQVAAKALFGMGAKKETAASGAPAPYICVDCGYIYEGDFKTVPASYKCPVCTSPKNRFKVYKGGDVKGRPNNSGAAMKKRKDEKKW